MPYGLTTELLKECRLTARHTAAILQLPLRQRVWSGGSGDFMGRGTGNSLDFQDHRVYTAGDDPRHINWQAYARTGQYSLKLYREDVRPVIDLILDGSSSAFLTPAKTRRTLELLYFCLESAHKLGASLNVFLVQGSKVQPIHPDALATETWISLLAEDAMPYPPEPPALTRLPLRPQSLRIFVSDLLFPGNPQTHLKELTARQGRAMLLACHCQEESGPSWEGNFEFEDVESRSVHPLRVEPGLLKRYQEAYSGHFSLWAEAAQRFGCGLSRVSAEADLPTALRSQALVHGLLELSNG